MSRFSHPAWLGAGLVATLLLTLACAQPGTGTERPEATSEIGRVFLLGVDGATWRVIDPMIRSGRLPNLGELARNGCRGTLLSDPVSRSPRIWTSMATGVEPETHGVEDFVRTVGDQRHLMSSDDVAVPRVWDIASEAGVEVGVTNYWVTYPVSGVRGFMISDHTILARSRGGIDFFTEGESPLPTRSGLVYPPDLWPVIDPILNRASLGADAADAPAGSLEANFVGVYYALANDEQALEMALAALETYRPRLNVIYLNGPDVVSHKYWRYYEPEHANFDTDRPTAREVALYGDVIPWVYRHVDAMVGEVLERLEPEDVLLIVSDHGFQAGKLDERGTSGDHETDGIYLAAGGPVAPPCPQQVSLYDVTPTLLYLLGLPVPEYMVGQPRVALVDPSFLASHPVRSTSQTATVERIEVDDRLEAVDAERLEQLKGLGYLD